MKGVLLINLGSTKSPAPEDVKVYLDEFLMDERTIDFPYWLRSLIVRGIILKTRPKKSGENYERIWWKEGSPLIVISEQLRDKVREEIEIPVEIGMRYGEPSIQNGLQKLVDQGVKEVILLPLYPQYTMSTIETAMVKAEEVRKEFFPALKFKTIPAFYDDPAYIETLSKSIAEALADVNHDHLLFSYHGIPVRHERKTNFIPQGETQKITYQDQCLRTTELVAEKLDLKEGTYSTAFQSRLGIDPWLKPFTDKTVQSFPAQNIKNLAIVAPAFVADCIETIDELGREAKEDFLKAGGEELTVIPCLNDRKDWVNTIVNWVMEN